MESVCWAALLLCCTELWLAGGDAHDNGTLLCLVQWVMMQGKAVAQDAKKLCCELLSHRDLLLSPAYYQTMLWQAVRCSQVALGKPWVF